MCVYHLALASELPQSSRHDTDLLTRLKCLPNSSSKKGEVLHPEAYFLIKKRKQRLGLLHCRLKRSPAFRLLFASTVGIDFCI